MIRFSAALVVVAIGVLVGGMVASNLLLVYVAIGLSVVALAVLALGVALKRDEFFGEQGQSALVGQGADAGFRQVTWAASPVPHTGAGAPWPPPAASGTPGPEIPPWRDRFASPVPQQPAAQTRVDTAQTRVDLAKTRTDFAETKANLTGAKADPAQTKTDTAPGRPAPLSWFERIAPARPADDDIKAEGADAADPPAGDAHTEAEAEDVTVEATEDEEETEAAGTNAAADTDAADTDAADTTEPSVVGPDAEAEAEDEDSVLAEAADNSPDGDQEDRSGQREVTVVPGVPRYHDTKCILIRFMGDDDLQKMTLDEAAKAGCTPCKACMPEHA